MNFRDLNAYDRRHEFLLSSMNSISTYCLKLEKMGRKNNTYDCDEGKRKNYDRLYNDKTNDPTYIK